ncbi:MAG: hypothetical protein JXA41_06390, partial [Deltaproteobacteria bacterium]|nr:hypothetical protein [Deltaproteobacteria bacterium]
MRRTRGWIICLLALVFLMGMVTADFAVAAPETQDTKTYFGHSVEGLEPVTLIQVADAPNNTGGDA